jgi:hypothetical protein
MHPVEPYAKLEQTVQHYIRELEQYDDQLFNVKRDETTWSVGQMYEHLLSSAYNLFFRKINACLTHQHGSLEGEKNKDGVKLFAYGSFPPMKIQMPEVWRGPQPIALPRQAYATALVNFLADVQQLGEEVAKDEGAYKTNHPALGMLIAKEWYQLLEMHFRHHLRQKKELDAFLATLAE